MRTRLSWAVAAIGALLLAPGGAEAQMQVAEGATVYAKNCTRCHNARSPLERTDREWVTVVAHMRARANLTKTQAANVLVFLQVANGTEEVQRPIAGSSDTGTPDIGTQIDDTDMTPKTPGLPSVSANGMVFPGALEQIARLVRVYTLALQLPAPQN